MSQQIIDIGTSAGAGDGDDLRIAFDKVNENFTEIYSGNVTAANLLVTSVAGRIGDVALTWMDVAGVANTGNITQLKQFIAANLVTAQQYTDSAIASLSSVSSITVASGTLANVHITGHSYGTMANLAVSGELSANSLTIGAGGLSIPNGNFVLANGSLVADSIIFGDATTMTSAPNFAPVNTSIAGVRANVNAANSAIVAVQAGVNAANVQITAQAGRIATLEANATTQALSLIALTTANSIQSGQINTLFANAGTQHGSIVSLRANIAAANAQIASDFAILSSNAASQQTQIDTLESDVVTINAAIASINAGSGLTAANAEIVKLRANITAANVAIETLSSVTTANAVTQAQAIAAIQATNTTQNSQISQLQANIAAANLVIAAANLTIANVQIAGLRANIEAANAAIGAVTTAWTANAATQAGLLTGLTSNASSQAVAITSLIANDVTQHTQITSLQASIAAANAAIAAIPNVNSLPGANIIGQVANSVVAGTVYNPLQPNITRVGNLTALTVDGNAQIDSLTASAFFGPVRTPAQPYITSVGTLASATVTGNVVAGNVSGATGKFTNVEGAILTPSQTNITAIGTLATLTVTGNVATGNVSTSTLTASRVVAGNLHGTIQTAVQTNITRIGTLPNLAVTGNAVAGNLVTTGTVTAPSLSGTILTASQPNITEIGTLPSLDVTGDITVGNIITSADVAFGNVYTGRLNAPIVDSGDIRGPLTTAAQTNITSVGTLTGLTVSGTTALANATVSGSLTVREVTANLTAHNVSIFSNVLVGNVNASFIRSSGNIQTGNILATGNVFLSGTGSYVHADIGDFSEVNGVVKNNVQPYITEIGTLTGLTVNGPVNITGSQFVAQDFYVTGNLFVNGNTTTVSAGNVTTSDKDLTLANGAVNSTAARGAGIYIGEGGVYGNISVYDGTWATAQNVAISGNLTAGNVGATQGTFTRVLGTLQTASQPNITEIGTLPSLNVTGNITGTIATSNQPFITNVGTLGNITVTGTARVGSLELLGGAGSTLAVDNLYLTANATMSNINVSGTANLGNISGTLITAAQPNITSIGTLSTLIVTGSVTTANITAAGATVKDLNATNANLSIAHVAGNVIAGNLSGATGTFTNVSAGFVSVTGNVNTASVNATNGTFTEVQGRVLTNAQPYITSVGTLDSLSVTGNVSTGNVSGATVTGTNLVGTLLTAAQPNITSIGTLPTLNVTGNATTGNISGATGTFTGIRGAILDASQTNITAVGTLGTLGVTGNVTTGNVSGATGVFTNVQGTLLTAAQPNITSIGTLGSLAVSGNITANVVASLIYGAYLTNPLQPNITQVGTLDTLSVTGNVSTGNVSGATGTFTNIRGAILDASQPAITTIGTLTGLTVSGTTTLANLTANGLTIKDLNTTHANIGADAIIVGNVTSANVGAFKGTFTQVEGTLLTNAQPFITSIGTLPSLSVTANVGAGNLNASTSNITGNSVTLNDLVTGTTDTNNLTVRGTGAFLSNIEAKTSLNVTNLLTVSGGNINAVGANIQASSALITNVAVGTLRVSNTEDALTSVTGAISTPGGISAGGNIYAGRKLIADGSITTAGDLTARAGNFGSSITINSGEPDIGIYSNVANVALFPSFATTIEFGGEATKVQIGEIGANLGVWDPANVTYSAGTVIDYTQSGIGATANLTFYGNGGIQSISIYTRGRQYVDLPNIRIINGGGSGFVGNVTTFANGSINYANVISPGSGYNTLTSVASFYNTKPNIALAPGNGNTIIRNDLTVHGGVFLKNGWGEGGIGNVTINNDLVVSNNLVVSNSISSGSLITGNITANANLRVGNFITVGNGFANAQTLSTNLNTGALQVLGGVGISRNLVVGAPLNTNSTVYINSVTATTSNATGALQVAGGISAKGNLWIEGEATIIGNVNFTAFVAASVNGTPIGNSSPSTGVFTTLALSNSRPSIRPSINFDFANSPFLPTALTYTRTGVAAYYDDRGLLKFANPHLPRFTYDSATLVPLGIRIEESRQNLYRESNSFANTSVYVTLNASVATATHQTTSPDGTYNAFKITDTTGNITHGIAQQAPYVPTITSSALYTASAFVKAGEYDQVSLIFFGENEPSIFDLTTGTVDFEGPSYASSIETLANGWYRIQSTVSKTNTDGNVVLALADGGTTLFAGTGTSGVYAYGLQLEAGGFATSYIPTTTIANTRGADSLTVNSDDFTRKYNPVESSVFVDAQLGYRPNRLVVNNQRSTLISFNDGTASNRISLVAENKAAPVRRFANLVIYSSGVEQANVSLHSSMGNISLPHGTANLTSSSLAGHTSSNDTGKLAVYFKSGLIGRAYNNVANVYATTGNISHSLTQIQLGAGPGTAALNGTISKVQIYTATVTGNELQTLTINQAEGAV